MMDESTYITTPTVLLKSNLIEKSNNVDKEVFSVQTVLILS